MNEQELYKLVKDPNREILWSAISYRYKLSEDFIREFKSKIDWKNIRRLY